MPETSSCRNTPRLYLHLPCVYDGMPRFCQQIGDRLRVNDILRVEACARFAYGAARTKTRGQHTEQCGAMCLGDQVAAVGGRARQPCISNSKR